MEKAEESWSRLQPAHTHIIQEKLLIALKIKSIRTLPLTTDVENGLLCLYHSLNGEWTLFSVAMAYFHFSHPLIFIPISFKQACIRAASLSLSLCPFLFHSRLRLKNKRKLKRDFFKNTSCKNSKVPCTISNRRSWSTLHLHTIFWISCFKFRWIKNCL